MATEAEAVTEQKPAAEEEPVKVSTEKKPKATKEKKPKHSKNLSHPPYFQMIKEALTALQENSGSSPYAIAKYMEEKHKDDLPSNFRKILGVQLKHFAAKGSLIKIRASYKLSDAAAAKAKKETKTKAPRTVKKTRSVTAAAKIKAESTAAAAPPKKAKKSAATKPKQPKSIKSPAAKKAKKAAA